MTFVQKFLILSPLIFLLTIPIKSESQSVIPYNLSLEQAIEIAQSLYPQAKVSFWTMASNQEPYYKIRLLQEEELRTTQGMTTLYIDAIEGKILANYNALKSPTGVKFLNSFYPIHNGEFLGIMGRIIVFLAGIWLTLMIVLGISLWWVKKTR